MLWYYRFKGIFSLPNAHIYAKLKKNSVAMSRTNQNLLVTFASNPHQCATQARKKTLIHQTIVNSDVACRIQRQVSVAYSTRDKNNDRGCHNAVKEAHIIRDASYTQSRTRVSSQIVDQLLLRAIIESGTNCRSMYWSRHWSFARYSRDNVIITEH